MRRRQLVLAGKKVMVVSHDELVGDPARQGEPRPSSVQDTSIRAAWCTEKAAVDDPRRPAAGRGHPPWSWK